MKKLTATLFLLVCLSFTVFADGDTPGGGKSCGAPGLPACFVQPAPTGKDDSTIDKAFVFVKNWLAGIFG